MTIQTIIEARQTVTQSLVLEFAGHWLTAHEHGFGSTDCTAHAMQLTNVSLNVPEHREIVRRAVLIVCASGICLH